MVLKASRLWACKCYSRLVDSLVSIKVMHDECVRYSSMIRCDAVGVALPGTHSKAGAALLIQHALHHPLASQAVPNIGTHPGGAAGRRVAAETLCPRALVSLTLTWSIQSHP